MTPTPRQLFMQWLDVYHAATRPTSDPLWQQLRATRVDALGAMAGIVAVTQNGVPGQGAELDRGGFSESSWAAARDLADALNRAFAIEESLRNGCTP